MKPSELLGIKGDLKRITGVYSQDKPTLQKYLNKDCLIAYARGILGDVFIIKGKRTNFAFFNLKDEIAGYIFNGMFCKRMGIKEAFNLIKKDVIVLNKREYLKMIKLSILENLK